ncbi:MAG: tripartite tricarboxylate transporter substrate binding protein [Betaproteobacteria bacterium]|nr:MAG: tripartite tricarboxylate transporter substrate binding protein [Betaproteobacteria bacterium]
MKHAFYLLKTAIVLFVLALAAASAHAAYPERAIHLIVPYPPGGLTDAVARAVAKALSDRVQQPVVIDNIAGGGGNIGADKAAKSPADGYTIFIGNNATVGLNTLVYKQLAFDPLADLAPIMLIAESQTVLVVNPALPVKNVAELIALAKSKPGQLNFGSTGTGGLSHLVGELFNSAAGIQMTHIPYKGTGPALTDLLGGQIQVMFNDTSLPHIQSGKLRALAVTGAKRWPQLPDVPTLAELGMPGYETYNWFGILAPVKTPAAIVARLNRELVAIMQDPAMKAWMESRGAEAVTSSPEEFAAYIKKDLAKWARVVKEVGITAE